MQYLEEKKPLRNIYKKVFRADNILPFLFVSILLYSIYTLTFGKHNLKVFFEKKQQEVKLQQDIQRLKEENKKLQKLIQKLKSDPYIIEKMARENLGLVKENDEIFVILEDKNKEKEAKSDRWIDKIKRIYKEYYLNN